MMSPHPRRSEKSWYFDALEVAHTKAASRLMRKPLSRAMRGASIRSQICRMEFCNEAS